MSLVRDCMFRNIATLSLASTLWEAVVQMTSQVPGFSVVLDRMTMVGLVTEYDLLRWLVDYPDPARVKMADLPLSAPQAVHENTDCQELLRIYNQRRFRRFPVINEEGMLSGGVMEKQIVASLPRSILLAHYRVADILNQKPPVVPPGMVCREVARHMIKTHRGCALVSDGQRLLGMISEGDWLRWRVRPAFAETSEATQFMTPDPVTIEPEQDLLHALDQFRLTGRRRLPVVRKDRTLVGLLTQTDILRQAVHAVRSRKAVLNPEDVSEPAIWFSPDGDHLIQAMNEKGAKTLGLEVAEWVGRSVGGLGDDPRVWDAVSVLLRHCGTMGPIHLMLKTGQGSRVCVGCRFQLINTPAGEDRIFWTVGELDTSVSCRY